MLDINVYWWYNADIMKRPSLKRPKSLKVTGLVAGVVVAGTVIGVAALNSPDKTDATDSPLVTQVDQQEKKLNNHEARITNTENDVKDLQNKTNTSPSTVRVEVPASQSSPAPTPSAPVSDAKTPIKVVSYRQIPLDNGDIDCEYTYADGTKYRWNWKISSQGSLVMVGPCDETSLRKYKDFD